MSLSGKQREKLQKALIDAFPNKSSIEQMLSFEFEINLTAIAGEGSLQDIVFKLIEIADSEGWIKDLVESARKLNSGNSKLKAIAEEILSNNPKFTNNRELPKPRQEDCIRNELLDTINIKVNDLLCSFLPNGQPINLLKQSQPSLIWQADTENFNPSLRLNPYPPFEKNIIEFSLQCKGRFLIIGEPGSGKTITLLELAQYFIKKAQDDSNEPIPVRFSLSSWRNQNMEEWLVIQLKNIYNVTHEDAWNLLINSKIIPLLDDLDQVDKSRQSKCVKAINKFLSSKYYNSKHLIVCSCKEQYKSNPCLNLNGAIELHPLNDVQIHDYLVDIGRSQLWTDIQHSLPILKLIKNPLFLSIILMLDEQNPTIEHCINYYNDQPETIRFLFDKYIDERFKDNRLFTNKKAKKWLRKIAIICKNENNLLIEEIQPKDCLVSNNQRKIYFSLITLIIGIIAYPIILLISILFLDYIKSSPKDDYPFSDEFYSVFRLIVLPILSMVLGFLISVLNLDIKPVETIKMPFKELVNAVKYANLQERLIGAVIANFKNFTDRIQYLIPISSVLQTSLGITSVLQTVLTGILGFLVAPTAALRDSIRGLRGEILNIEDRKIVNQGIKNSAINGIKVAFIYGLLLFLLGCFLGLIGSDKSRSHNPYEWFYSGISFALLGGLFGGLFGGVLAYIQHFTLRLIIASHGDMPLRYVRFLDYATKQRLLQREDGRYRFIHPLLKKHFTEINIR